MDIVVAAGAAILGTATGAGIYRLWMQTTLGSHAEQAQRVLGAAEEEKERLLRAAEMDAKEQLLKVQEDFEREARQHREEVAVEEKRLRKRETRLESRSETLDKRDRRLRDKERAAQEAAQKAEALLKESKGRLDAAEAELERVGELTRAEARVALIQEIEDDARAEALVRVKEIEEQAVAEAEGLAQRVIAGAVQRFAGGFVSEKTISVVRLPSDEMKGRIIGREGRNIRALETATGVDIVIDDTPEVVILSAFDPYRREIARLALTRLIEDGRIHPSRIEEVVDTVSDEMEERLLHKGESVVLELGQQGFSRELLRLLGLAEFRVIQGQNLLTHLQETAMFAGMIAAEVGADAVGAQRAGLLHDLGRCVEHSVPGTHAGIAADLAKRHGERKSVVKAVREHHETTPRSTLGCILQAADLLSKARPGARRASADVALRRFEDMEKICRSFEGVEQAFAIQAGTEVRVMVNYNQVSEREALALSREIADRIEDDLSYPGEVRVSVIREARASVVAR